ncbi:MAG TPA: MFS transporter [Ktedonobacteraceae bacterium]|nr:MFS transporter [Ktedonobacteraceae bacterium]
MHLFVEYARQFARFSRNARLYLISNALSGVTAGILLVLYNLYLASLGYGADFIGTVLFVGTVGAGLAIFPAGIIIDRFSGKAILIWSSALIGLAGAGQILFRQPLPLLASAFVAGIGLAFILVINAPFLTLNSTPDERPQLFSMNIAISLITLVLGEILGGILPIWLRGIPWLMAPLPSSASGLLASQPYPRSYQIALLFAGIIAAPSFIPLFLMSSTKPRQDQEGRDDHERDQSALYRSSWRSMAASIASFKAWFLAIRRAQWKKVLASPFFVLLLVQIFIGLGAGLFIPYFNLFFVKHLGASSALFGFIDAGANTITALLTLAAPWLALHIGKVNTMVWTRLISIPLMITIGLTGLLPLAAALYLFRQGAMDMSNGILQVFSMEAVSEQKRGLANSGYQAAFQGAEAITTPIGGLMIVHLGYSSVFLLAPIFYLPAIGILWGKFGRGRGRRDDDKTAPRAINTTPNSSKVFPTASGVNSANQANPPN